MARLEVRELAVRDRPPCSFEVDGGECLGLEGVSGAGKSLLLRAIADLDPHQGMVFLDGRECGSMPAPLWRRTVALLPAESGWWLDTVAAHFQDFAGLSPELLQGVGFGVDVGSWQISRLSTGEKQRLAVVRMLENRPRVLLLDEPTASLDAENILRVERVLLEYARGQDAPLLWVSHDPAQLERVAERILHMDRHGMLSGKE